MSELLTLGGVCSAIVDCEHKTAPEDPEGQAYSIGTKAMSDGRIDWSHAKRVSLETFEAWSRRLTPREGDLILAREAPVGPVVRVPADHLVVLGQRTVLLRPDRAVVDSRYLHFLLLSEQIQQLMHSKSEGSTVRHLNVADVRDLPLPALPSVAEQRVIAGVLGALDDKIESNRRLAVLAMELMRSTWARFALRAPIGRIGDIVRSSATRVNSQASAVTVLSATSAGRLVPSDEFFVKRVYSKDISKYLAVRPWAFAYNPSRANIGSIGMHRGPRLGAVSPVYVVAQTDGPASAWWLEFALRTEVVRAEILTLSSGSVRQVLRFEDLSSIRIPLPDASERATFFQEVEDLIALNDRSVSETAPLAALRDALLPELLSGRLRVREAEKVVEDVV